MLELKKIFNNKKDFVLKKINQHLIPYACHYDANTILNKNGELLQTIKISDFSEEVIRATRQDIRQKIRDLLSANEHKDSISVWLNLIRKKTNIDPGGNYHLTFNDDVHISWSRKNYWEEKFVNELYITIVYKGKSFKIDNKLHFLDSLSLKMQQDSHLKYLLDSNSILTSEVNKIMEQLSSYGAKKLGMRVIEGEVYSEPAQFFLELLTNEITLVGVKNTDLSELLSESKVVFGLEGFETIIHDMPKKFGAIFSAKGYADYNISLVDEVLRTPEEFVITEIINFVDANSLKKHTEYLRYLYHVSKDEETLELSGVNNLINSTINDCLIEHQLTFMLRTESLDSLQKRINNFTKKLLKLGVNLVKEDVNIENAFFSQLPGNINYIKRKIQNSSSSAATFCSFLGSSPNGEMKSKWGNAITVFRSKFATPYFFNFHNNNEDGNSLVIGPLNSGKTILVNFLLSETMKFQPQIFYLDQDPNSEVLISLLNGEVCILGDKKNPAKINPLLLEDNNNNRLFLQKWLATLVFADQIPEKEDRKIFESLINYNYETPIENRNLENIANKCHSTKIRSELLKWVGEGECSSIFDHNEDLFVNNKSAVFGFNFVNILANDLLKNKALVPLVFYITYQFTSRLNQNIPSIIVFNELDVFLNNHLFKRDIESWLAELTSNNAIAIMNLDSDKLRKNQELSLFTKACKNQLLISNVKATNEDISLLEFTNEEADVFRSMKVINRNFIVRKNNELHVLELNLDGINYAIKSFSGGQYLIDLVRNLKDKYGSNVENWIGEYYKNLVEK